MKKVIGDMDSLSDLRLLADYIMESKGLRWPLDGLRWNRGDIGVSNEMTGNDFSVTMKTGRLIMVTEI
ncbi:MAG: hypothetical protein E4H36_00645 [Spirochaetales bacterium]|nr:MAG: hypothetical protein E4H36_00645 [Spirochaetales bacterium]